GDPALADGVGHVEGAVHDDVGDGVEAARRQILGLADEIACGIVDQSVQRAAVGPDLVHYGLHRARVADIERMRFYAAAVPSHQFAGGCVENRFAASANIQISAQLEIARADLAAQARATTSDENTFAFEYIIPEHGEF